MRPIRLIGRIRAIVVGVAVLASASAMIVYPSRYVFRVFVWLESDAFDWRNFPSHPPDAAPAPYHFEESPDPRVA